MKLHKHQYIVGIMRFIALAVSLLFGIYGVAILFAALSLYLIIFSALMISYCIGILALLIITHKKFIKENQIDILIKSNVTLLILLPFAWFIGSLDLGIISGQEILSVILVAFCSAIAWFGVSISIKNNIKILHNQTFQRKPKQPGTR